MAKTKDSWHGTLMLVGQPAEEIITGARKMVDDGLFTKFPKPNVGVAMHDENGIAAGQFGITPSYAKANADSLRITVYGKGGHGPRPESTTDPALIPPTIPVPLHSTTSP